MAAIELHAGRPFDADAFDRFLDEQPDLGTKWRPAFVRVEDDLPKLSSLKVDKKALRREAWRAAHVVWRPDKAAGLLPIDEEDSRRLDQLLTGRDRGAGNQERGRT